MKRSQVAEMLAAEHRKDGSIVVDGVGVVRGRSCTEKLSYRTPGEAEAAKHAMGRRGRKLRIYRCHFEAHYHLTGRRSQRPAPDNPHARTDPDD